MNPFIGADVHYTSYGTPGGEYGKECRAAKITAVAADLNTVSLVVFNPTGLFFLEETRFHDGAETVGTPNCPVAASHGSPFRYCACGWIESSYAGGTWHWSHHP